MIKKVIFFIFTFHFFFSASTFSQEQTPEEINTIISNVQKKIHHSDYYESSYTVYAEQIENTSGISRLIWQYNMAELLFYYWRDHKSAISQRTAVASEQDTDFKSWDSYTFMTVINGYYVSIFEQTGILQKTPLEKYNILFDQTLYQIYRPTLYDVIAQSALYFYTYAEWEDSQYPLFFVDSSYFSDNVQFFNIELNVKDTSSFRYATIKLYQKLTAFHLNDINPLALIDITLNRLNYIRICSKDSMAGFLHEKALLRMVEKYIDKNGYADICYQLGLLYFKRAGFYKQEKDTNASQNLHTAVEWLQQVITQDSQAHLTDNAKALIKVIQEKSIQISFQESLPANQPNLMEVTYRNCDSLFIRIFPIVDYFSDRRNNRDRYDSLLQREYLFQWEYALIDHHDFKQNKGEIILPPLPSGNYFLLASSNRFKKEQNEGYDISVIQVSNLAYSKEEKQVKKRVLLYDRMKGNPVGRANFHVNYQKDDKIKYKQRRRTNRDGLASFTFPFWEPHFYGDIFVEFKTDSDTLTDIHDEMGYHYRYRYSHRYSHSFSQNRKRTYITTDRAIYRPGQTVFFKAIRARRTKNGAKILPYRNLKMVLHGNNTTIAIVEAKTNQFGSCSGSFEIPMEIKTGEYRIEAYKKGGREFNREYYNNSLSIQIEEYKRPQFEVSIHQPEKAYKLDDEVEINGNVLAFSGYPVGNAIVSYEVRESGSASGSSYYDGLLIDYGQTTTDEMGNFSFNFIAKSNEEKKNNSVSSFEVTVSVTDVTGETQQSKTNLLIGSKALTFLLDIPQVVTKDKTKNQFLLSVINSSGKKISSEVDFKIVKLKTPDHFLISGPGKSATVALTDIEELKKTFPYRDFENKSEKKNWTEAEVISSGVKNIETDSLISLPQSSSLTEGYYKINLSTTDPLGQKVEEEIYFFLLDPHDKGCGAYLATFLHVDKTRSYIGDTVTVTVGSYYEDAYIYMQFYTSKNKLIHSEWITLNKEKKVYEIPIKKKHQKGLIIFAQSTKYNHVDSRREAVYVTSLKNVKWIDIKSSSFKDRVEPGNEEEWEIEVKNANGKKRHAEALVSMYDASLEQFKPFTFLNDTWVWGRRFQFYAYPFESKNNNYYYRHLTGFQYPARSFNPQLYPSLVWVFRKSPVRNYGYIRIRYSYKEVRKTPGRSISGPYSPPLFDNLSGVASMDGSITSVRGNRADGQQTIIDGIKVRASSNVATSSDDGAANLKELLQTVKPSVPPVIIRSNFNETAFFYPQLKTDRKGKISFTFKTSESLTRWNLQILAHNKRGDYGFLTHKILAQKDLMIAPNVPRFVREGDTLDFTSKVVSLVDERLSGQVNIEFTDALTGNSISIILGNNQTYFDLKGKESIEVKFKVAIPVGIGAIKYRITAISEKFSDGEEKIIPVLSNRILVTESLPLYVNSYETNHFVLNNLKNNHSQTTDQCRYTIEFTANPSWYAIQALPYLMQYPHECNEQMFSRLYANAIGLHILNHSPQLKILFEKWEALPEEKFISNLDKNQELKSIVLEESPWLLASDKQQIDKQRLAVLFNLKKMVQQQSGAADKLQRRQSSSGAWPWFAGGEDNYFITQHIVAGFGHLKSMGIETGFQRYALAKAVAYLDKEMQKQYEKWLEHNPQYGDGDLLSLPTITFHYLYARSYFLDEFPINKTHLPFYEKCIQSAKRNWQTKSIYMQALTALALHRNGDIETATAIVNSLKEISQYSNEMGMYWEKEGSGYFWYESPIERQVALIEAFDVVLQDHESVEKMQRWLLKERQAQYWSNTKATTEACYALLMRGAEPGFKEPEITINIGHHEIQLAKHPDTEPGSGYFKTSWSGQEITPDMADITVSNSANGIAWGGVYWQYFEETDQIETAQTSLSLRKELYRVSLDDKGEFLTKITEENPLKVGDKIIVKLIIKTDRNMEYVHLKDMRAAAFEPVNVLSAYKYQGGLRYYESTRDAATNFFIDYLPKGNYVLEYTLIASQTGSFNNGIATIECMYAPEFSAHSEGIKIHINSNK